MSVIFITGANRGIGLSLTQLYLRAGHTVYATYRNEGSSRSLLALKTKHSNLSCIELDVTDYALIQEIGSSIDSIDLLINNAGYYGPKGYNLGNHRC
ncbi:SDR family NAD(P)-dependent oxidoreductase [Psychromonas sp. KJ10-10]|uniref:SDR family NAD(P)-dependent oxidoreductase n=1 Tax=Psychromonas sp. KJ10-10 TaxID=3391823 RepID=UPI0039B6A2D1